MRRIFSTVRRPQEPALTVESFAIRATRRPPILPSPVITPSAGSSGSRAFARTPSSRKLPSSSRRRTRSRANSFPVSAFFWWYFGAPPFSIRRSSPLIFSSNANFTSEPAASSRRQRRREASHRSLACDGQARPLAGAERAIRSVRNGERQAAGGAGRRRRRRHREADADGQAAALARHPAQ